MAALSNLSGLDATWKSISPVETAMKRKLVMNSVINPLTALLGCRNGDLLESAEARKFISRGCAEAARAFGMRAQEEEGSQDDREKPVRIRSGSGCVPLGLDTQARALEEECLRVMRVNVGNISSMLSDVRTGSYTEIEYYMNRWFGLPIMMTATLLNLVKLRTTIPLDHLVYK